MLGFFRLGYVVCGGGGFAGGGFDYILYVGGREFRVAGRVVVGKSGSRVVWRITRFTEVVGRFLGGNSLVVAFVNVFVLDVDV